MTLNGCVYSSRVCVPVSVCMCGWWGRSQKWTLLISWRGILNLKSLKLFLFCASLDVDCMTGELCDPCAMLSGWAWREHNRRELVTRVTAAQPNCPFCWLRNTRRSKSQWGPRRAPWGTGPPFSAGQWYKAVLQQASNHTAHCIPLASQRNKHLHTQSHKAKCGAGLARLITPFEALRSCTDTQYVLYSTTAMLMHC